MQTWQSVLQQRNPFKRLHHSRLSSQAVYADVTKWLSYILYKEMVAGAQVPFCNVCPYEIVHVLH